MAKRMLADVLWEAANVHLSPDTKDTGTVDECSCIAAKIAYYGGSRDSDGYQQGSDTPITDFLAELGCGWHSTAFLAFPAGKKRQGARYLWLLLAMHVAEDEGIEVDA